MIRRDHPLSFFGLATIATDVRAQYKLKTVFDVEILL
jgi:hypothetical protein